jgi:hypothetical protein
MAISAKRFEVIQFIVFMVAILMMNIQLTLMLWNKLATRAIITYKPTILPTVPAMLMLAPSLFRIITSKSSALMFPFQLDRTTNQTNPR